MLKFPGICHLTSPGVLVIYFWETNDYKLSGISHTLSLTFFRSGEWTWPNWVLCLGSPRAAIKVLARTGFSSEAQVGKNVLPGSLGLLAEFIMVGGLIAVAVSDSHGVGDSSKTGTTFLEITAFLGNQA
jgi:hypothetical protein